MGVKLKDIIEPEQITFKDLEGRVVSIDAFNTLYQFLSTIRQRDGRPLTDENGNVTSHLSGILYRNSSMIEKDIKPIYIFDGQAPELKSETQAKRREIRDEAEQIYKDALKAGDFKYQDMNGDGFVDTSDQCVIGDSTPKLIGAISLNLDWKGFDFALTGTFRAFCDVALSNSYFWNGWGDSNYSYYTLKHISDSKAPRLTYNKVNNNFQLSERWLADGSFFKIQSIELGYSIPVSRWSVGKVVRGLRVYASANNLLTLSGIEDVDPEALGSGLSNYPLMRSFTGGIKMTF